MRLHYIICGAVLLSAAAVTAQTPGPKAQRAQKRAVRAQAAPKPTPDFADLSYGPFPNNQLDLWLAKSKSPTPLVVFIHGGGFTGGDKSVANPVFIRRCLDKGVSYAAINYRFRTEVPIQTVLRDCARAIQFLRWKAKDYNLDPKRVASMGGSAGAGTSLWLAFHPDLADSGSPDPVLRQSTRIVAAAATATQATYDVLRWQEFLGDAVLQIAKTADLPKFYGLRTEEEVKGVVGRKVRADVDMLGLITPDDPPVMLISSHEHDVLKNMGDVNHSSKHAIAVKNRCDEVGVTAVLRIVDGSVNTNAGESSPIDFLLKYLLETR